MNQNHKYCEHVGIHKKRLNEHNPREIVFAEQWKKENRNEQDICICRLQQLMCEVSCEPKEGFSKRYSVFMFSRKEWVKYHHKITQRDAEIVATVIQWLGSNMGMSFLETALNRCGKKIVDMKND